MAGAVEDLIANREQRGERGGGLGPEARNESDDPGQRLQDRLRLRPYLAEVLWAWGGRSGGRCCYRCLWIGESSIDVLAQLLQSLLVERGRVGHGGTPRVGVTT